MLLVTDGIASSPGLGTRSPTRFPTRVVTQPSASWSLPAGLARPLPLVLVSLLLVLGATPATTQAQRPDSTLLKRFQRANTALQDGRTERAQPEPDRRLAGNEIRGDVWNHEADASQTDRDARAESGETFPTAAPVGRPRLEHPDERPVDPDEEARHGRDVAERR